MTRAEECLRLVDELPASYTEALIAKLRSGSRAVSLPNPAYNALIEEFLRQATVPPNELASMLEVSLYARRPEPSVELVWTGPTTSVLPVRQTEQVLLEIVREAHERLTILSFGIFQIPRIVAALEDALQRGLKVRIILGERENQLDLTQASQRRELGGRIMELASVYYWPLDQRLRDQQGRPGLMHVKAAIADARILLLSSANLTESALERNMELGVLLKAGDAASRAERHVDALITAGNLALVFP